MEATTESVANVVTSINTMLYGMEDQIQAIVDRLSSEAHDSLDAVADAIAPIAMRAVESTDIVLPGEGDVAGDWDALDRILSSLNGQIGDAELTVAQSTDRAVASVDSGIADATVGSGDLISGLLSALSDLISGLFGSLAEAPELWQAMYSVIRDSVQQDSDVIGRGTGQATGWIAAKLGDILGSAIKDYTVISGAVMTGNDVKKLDPDALAARMDAWPDWVKSIGDIVLEMVSAWGILSALSAPKVSEAEQGSLKLNPISPLSVSQLVALLRREEITEGWAKDHAKRTGFSPEIFDLVAKLTRAFLTPDNYMEMWRRTGDDSQLDNLRLLGISDDDISRLRTLALAIPTPSDLVRFMVRDAFDPTAIAAGNLDFEFDKKVDPDWNRKVGVDVDTLRLYWRSHWTLPSPTMYYEMFHRGFITDQQMRDALAVSDFAPGWIDNLVKINYNVPGRIDIRRMYEAGIITTHAELVKRHQDMGYSPEDAETLSTFVERIAAKSAEADAERLHAPIANEIIRSYAAGGLDYDTAHADMIGLGYTDDVATYRLQLGIFQRERDRAQRIRDALHRQFVASEVDEAEARARLEHYGFEANEQDSLLDSWKLDLELKGYSDEKRHQRDLSKNELLEAYRDGLLPKSNTISALADLGYDQQESATLVGLEDARENRAEAKLVEQAVRTEYLSRRIEATEVANTLRGFGYREDRIAALLTRWSVEREDKRPDLSPALLERMLMQGIVTRDVIHDRLLQAGFTEGDVSLLLTLYGTDVSVAADTLAERKREFDLRQAQQKDLAQQRINLTTRGQDLTTGRFTVQQAGLQQRFEATQAQQVALQTERLQANVTAENTRIAAQTARDAAAFAARRETTAKQIEAAAKRTQAQIDAAAQRQVIAGQQKATALQSQAQLQTQRLQSQSQLQTQRLQASQAQADQRVAAATQRQQAAAAQQASLEQLRQQHQDDLTQLRAQIQQARDIQTNANKIAAENRAEQQRIRTEQRGQARKDLTTGQAQAAAASMDALKFQQSAAVAQLSAQFATLSAQLAQQRQQQALVLQQAATAALAAATPISSLLDTNV